MTIKDNSIIGKKFGRLTVIEKKSRSAHGDIMWLCVCECTKEVVVISSNLQKGNTKSCGCLHKEKTSKARKINLTGKRFGKLIVIKENGINKDGRINWSCLCDCGKIKIINSHSLLTGSSQSCGCELSRGNNRIEEILILLNITFIKEKRFNNCRDKNTLPFDFYLPDHNLCIEYQGRQHYKVSDWSETNEKNESNFKQIQKHDQIKNNYCKKNNIRLLEIKYTDFGKIEEILKTEI